MVKDFFRKYQYYSVLVLDADSPFNKPNEFYDGILPGPGIEPEMEAFVVSPTRSVEVTW